MNLDENIKNQIEQLIQENDVFLFMKGNPDFPMCGFSSVASAILKKCGVEFGHCNVLENEEIREGIKAFLPCGVWVLSPYVHRDLYCIHDTSEEMSFSMLSIHSL